MIFHQAGEEPKTNSMIFSLKNQPGGLARALKVFHVSLNASKLDYLFAVWLNGDLDAQTKRINVVHIESRRSQRRNSEFEILVRSFFLAQIWFLAIAK